MSEKNSENLDVNSLMCYKINKKKNQMKRQNRKKMINKIKKRVHYGAKLYGSWTTILKNLSQLIGA